MIAQFVPRSVLRQIFSFDLLEVFMPKMKSHGGAKKRYKVTGSGQIKRQKAFRAHILTSKTRKRKRQLRQDSLVHTANLKLVRRQLVIG
jgi:large subunit ribosomal protein L35